MTLTVSILILLELPFDMSVRHMTEMSYFVSILILLELPFDNFIKIYLSFIGRVSILILLELPFDQKYSESRKENIKFQSLFYWNCRLIRYSSSRPARHVSVSILILLELPFDLQVFHAPLCRGSVSILILLELPFDTENAKRIASIN